MGPSRQGPCNIQQDAPQRRSFIPAPGCSQYSSDDSSENSSCDYSPSNLSHHDEDGTCNFQQIVPYHLSFMKFPGCSQAAEESISASEKYSCDYSPSNLSYHDGPCNIQQDAPQRRSFIPAPGCSQYSSDDSSENSSCDYSPSNLSHHDEDGLYKIQQDTPRPESRVEAPGCSQEAGEYASSSEYFTCVSSPSKLFCYNKDGIKERIVPKDLVQTDSSSDYSYSSNSSHSPSNKEPGLMKIYYMRVQMKRGVAVLCHTGEGWEPPSKKIKMEEMTYTTEVHKNVPLSHMSGENLLNDPEPSVDSPAQEKREKAGCCSQPSTLVAYRRVPLRRALDSGFRCLACCHVFASLEALQRHVEHGVREGFSCHVFHRAMARLKYKKLKRKNKKLVKATLSGQEEHHLTGRQT
ncbi:hypothetical protein QTO34_014399 [Cnephaeus nilssonii]|uniref:Uncharacterized protein n=1 Tax=Cnephaeus nilssonii TaxID=3371016 RepID=A0AA40LS91_CNENI|nr:hypothetical protein QTO34_014399 [Eptesicus nilssonii]